MRRPPERGVRPAKRPPASSSPTPIRKGQPAKAAVTKQSKRPRILRKGRRQDSAQLMMKKTADRFRSASRTRRTVVLTLLGSLGALLLVVIATLTTPLLAVDKIKVTGNQSVSTKKIVAAVKDQIGVPLALINQQHIIDELSGFTNIESVSVMAQLPHTLHLAITERSAIGIVVVSGVGYLYDPAGIRLGVARSSDMLPLISSSGDPKKSESFNQAIDVLLALPAPLLARVASINALSQDNVTLQLRGYAGQTIIWGDASQAVLKSRVLAALIANQKQTDRVTFDVSSPSAPVVRWH